MKARWSDTAIRGLDFHNRNALARRPAPLSSVPTRNVSGPTPQVVMARYLNTIVAVGATRCTRNTVSFPFHGQFIARPTLASTQLR